MKMAIQDDRYGIIYYNEVTTFLAYTRTLRIEIRKRDYTGPFTKESIGANLNVDGDVVKKTVANLRFKAKQDNQFENLLNDGTMFKVYIQLDDEIIFTGFIDADSFERDYTTTTNYDVLFIARDRLGALEDSKILKDWDFTTNPTIDLETLFNKILRPTELYLPLSQKIGVSANGMVDYMRVLEQIFINPYASKVDDKKTNLDFLEELLEALSCTIQQKNGYWHIEESTLKTERSLIQKSDIHLLHSSATQITKKGLKKIDFKQDLQSTENIFKAFPVDDDDFTKVEQLLNDNRYLCYIPEWTMYGTSYVMRSFDIGADYFTTYSTHEWGIFTMYTTIHLMKTENPVSIIFDLATPAPDNDLQKLEFDIYCGDKMLTLGGWVDKTDVKKNLVFKIPGYEISGEPNFQKITLIADGIPYDTGLEIHFYTVHVDYKDIIIKEQYESTYTLPADKELDFVVNEKNTQKVSEEVAFGQVPDFNNSFHNFLGGFYDANKNALIDWKHKNDIQVYDLLQVITDTKVWESGRKRSINAVLAWNYDLFTNIEIEGIKYFIKDVNSWNLSDNELDVQLEEIVEYIEGSKPILKPAVVGDARNIKMIGSSKTNYLTYTNKDITVPVRISALESADLAYSSDAYVMVDLPNSSDSKKMFVKDLGDKDGSSTQNFETKDLKVHGDLTVYGEVISSPSVEIPIDDAWIKLNNGNSEVDAGIRIDLGGGQTSQIYRKASDDAWYVDSHKIYNSGNLNKPDVDFTAKTITAKGVNDFIMAGNEFNFVKEYTPTNLWFNYRGAQVAKGIRQYVFGDGLGGATHIRTKTLTTVDAGVEILGNIAYHAGNLNNSDIDFAAKIINAENVFISNHQVYHTDNLNKSTIDFTAKNIVSESIKSPNFQNGLLGVGHKFDNGIGELDTLTIRKTMNVYEMLINKVRSIGGEFLISSANGKITKIIGSSASAREVAFDIETSFIINDLVVCQTFTGGDVKYYIAKVYRVTSSKSIILTLIYGDLSNVSIGDELIQQGNTNDSSGRQNMLLLSARTARFSIFQGVNSANLDARLKGVFGDLNGLNDSEMGDLSGVGLYCDNVYLRGIMKLSSGSSISFTDVSGTDDLETKTGAQDKANEAKSGAINTASTDATSKANTAEANAKILSDTAQTKANSAFALADTKITENQATTITNNTIKTTNVVATNLKVKFANVENFSFDNATGENVNLSGIMTLATGSSISFADVTGTDDIATNESVNASVNGGLNLLGNTQYVGSSAWINDLSSRVHIEGDRRYISPIGYQFTMVQDIILDNSKTYVLSVYLRSKSGQRMRVAYGGIDYYTNESNVSNEWRRVDVIIRNPAITDNHKMYFLGESNDPLKVLDIGEIWLTESSTRYAYSTNPSDLAFSQITADTAQGDADTALVNAGIAQVKANSAFALADTKITEDQATIITNNTIKTTNVVATNLKVKFANVENFTFDNASGTNVNLTGVINAESGKIGGLTLTEFELKTNTPSNNSFALNWEDNTMTFTTLEAEEYSAGQAIEWYGSYNSGLNTLMGGLAIKPHPVSNGVDAFDIILWATQDLIFSARENIIINSYNDINLNCKYGTRTVNVDGHVSVNGVFTTEIVTITSTASYTILKEARTICFSIVPSSAFLPSNPKKGEKHTIKNNYTGGTIRIWSNGKTIDNNFTYTDISSGNAQTLEYTGTIWIRTSKF